MNDEFASFKPDSFSPESMSKKSVIFRWLKVAGFFMTIIFLFLGVSYYYLTSLNQPPVNFPVGTPIIIETGTEVQDVTQILQDKDVVQSSFLLYYILVFFNNPTDVKASTYIFDKPLSTFAVAESLVRGDFDTDLIRFTHYEGERVTMLANRADKALPDFDKVAFIEEATPFEGRLFPDTYFVPANYTDEQLLELLLATFTDKTKSLENKIAAQDLTLDEVLTLASIVEREANTIESKKMVSGILQNRMEIGMPLQADASIEYILDKPLAELTSADLEIDSPYNTYINLGLPPTPIGNPGLDAIEAVLEPTESDYFYYITDNEGVFHYSKTYNEHLRNIEKYLR